MIIFASRLSVSEGEGRQERAPVREPRAEKHSEAKSLRPAYQIVHPLPVCDSYPIFQTTVAYSILKDLGLSNDSRECGRLRFRV
jgi:hypothetical protein